PNKFILFMVRRPKEVPLVVEGLPQSFLNKIPLRLILWHFRFANFLKVDKLNATAYYFYQAKVGFLSRQENV
ncbi:MAG: hypothetical protein ABL927_13910, partial [Bdellovibrionales bacterium]